jgi:hypothetical protein
MNIFHKIVPQNRVFFSEELPQQTRRASSLYTSSATAIRIWFLVILAHLASYGRTTERHSAEAVYNSYIVIHIKTF